MNLVRDLESDPSVEIVPASAQLFRAGFDLFARRPDKDWSLVDCLSFMVMKQRRLKEALRPEWMRVHAFANIFGICGRQMGPSCR